MQECYLCGVQEGLHRHHIDWNHSNNERFNLMWLCSRCHTEVHKGSYLSREEFNAIRGRVKIRDPGRFGKLPMFENL